MKYIARSIQEDGKNAMKKGFYLLSFLFMITSTTSLFAFNLDEEINNFFLPIVGNITKFVFFRVSITSNLEVPLVICWLIFAAVFVTFYFRFINLWGFKIAVGILNGKYDLDQGSGEVSHF